MTGIMIRTKIAQMHNCMKGRLDENEPANHFVDVNVIVQGQNEGQTKLSQLGDGVTQHKHQDYCRVEQKNPPVGPLKNVKKT